jgi:hypothetical protein
LRLAAAVILAGGCAASPPAFAQTKLSVNVLASFDAELQGYSRTNSNCEAIDPPEIRIYRPPEHGIVCLRHAERLKLQSTLENNFAHCLGKRVSGVVVVYLPAGGYAGSDKVSYTVVFPTIQRKVEVALTVLADQIKEQKSAATTATRQSSGPIPDCKPGLMTATH